MLQHNQPTMTPLSKRQKIIMYISVTILTIQFIGFFALLGSLQQIYKSITVLTELTATCAMNEGNLKKKSVFKLEKRNAQYSEDSN